MDVIYGAVLIIKGPHKGKVGWSEGRIEEGGVPVYLGNFGCKPKFIKPHHLKQASHMNPSLTDEQ